MNLVNRSMTGLFDVLLAPFELLGSELARLLVSGLVGIVCLIIFKFISWQKGIKGVKNKIKGNMIAIRIYQDDLGVVFKSVVGVSAKIEVHDPGGVARSEGKAKRVIDTRGG